MELPRPTDYLGAAIPLPVRVIGTRLKPFSLGHLLLLQRLGNSFVTPGVPFTIGDLLTGIIICSRDYSEAVTALDSWRASWHARGLGWRVRLSGVSLVECVAVFRKYIESGSRAPSYVPPQQSGKRIAAPLPMLVKVYLQRHLNYTPAEALNVPWCAALHEYAISLAIDDRLELVDDDYVAELAEYSKPMSDEDKAKLDAALRRVS
jgi:hypothetical protein